MSYELRSPLDQTDQIEIDPIAVKTVGTAEILNTALVFYPKTLAIGERGFGIARAQIVAVDSDTSIAYNPGDLVYDSDTTPTGTVNKTSGAGRRIVGRVFRFKAIADTSKLLIRFDGANG